MLKILDISQYQPNVDYAKVKNDINGVLLRCGFTGWGSQTLHKDPFFEQHYKGFKAQGVPVGVYYYSAADSIASAQKEADFCLSLLKGKQLELPVYYDVENNERQGKLGKQSITQIVDAFCSKLKNAGYFVGYYSYTAWLQSKFDTVFLSSKYTLWKADYRANYDKAIACDMHQYTSSGAVSGISSRVDLNNCYVDFAKTIKEKGLNGFAAVPPKQPISKEPVRLYIGFASGGDIKAICALLTSLAIVWQTNESGYIISELTSSGDQLTVMAKCDELGIPCVEYVEVPKNDCECSELKAVNARLVAEIAEKNKKSLELEGKLEKIREVLQ